MARICSFLILLVVISPEASASAYGFMRKLSRETLSASNSTQALSDIVDSINSTDTNSEAALSDADGAATDDSQDAKDTDSEQTDAAKADDADVQDSDSSEDSESAETQKAADAAETQAEGSEPATEVTGVVEEDAVADADKSSEPSDDDSDAAEPASFAQDEATPATTPSKAKPKAKAPAKATPAHKKKAKAKNADKKAFIQNSHHQVYYNDVSDNDVQDALERHTSGKGPATVRTAAPATRIAARTLPPVTKRDLQRRPQKMGPRKRKRHRRLKRALMLHCMVALLVPALKCPAPRQAPTWPCMPMVVLMRPPTKPCMDRAIRANRIL